MAEMPVSKEALIEAKKNAMSKKMYGATIKLHCIECIGERPKEKLCQGCLMFSVSTQEKRKKFLKTEIKKMIREFCTDCCGTTYDICVSKGCAFYPFRRGQSKTKADWKASVLAYAKRRKTLGRNNQPNLDNQIEEN
jgi:hypothetical protein